MGDSIQLLNKRAYYYMKLARAFKDGLVDIDDEELAEELMYIKLDWTSKGVIKIIPKKDIKKVLLRSPDKADAMMLAYAEDEDSGDADFIRIL
jgi:hypothetical protein